MADLTLVLSSLILFEIGRGSRALLDSNHDRLWAEPLLYVSFAKPDFLHPIHAALGRVIESAGRFDQRRRDESSHKAAPLAPFSL